MKITPINTTREALIAELLKDVDALVQRVEACDTKISEKITSATDRAARDALSATRQDFVSTLETVRSKLVMSGKNAAQAISDQLDGRILTLTALNKDLRRRTGLYLWLAFVFSVLAGSAGGVVAAKILFDVAVR